MKGKTQCPLEQERRNFSYSSSMESSVNPGMGYRKAQDRIDCKANKVWQTGFEIDDDQSRGQTVVL